MAKLCRKCGILLDDYYTERGKEYHDPCAPDSVYFSDPAIQATRFTNGNPYANKLREEITDIVLWANNQSERSQQVELGASEVGVTCLRRLGYRVAQVPPVNWSDPWPAIVGTAVHTWLEDAVKRYEKTHQFNRWYTEITVHPSASVQGHTDLYDAYECAVIDYKNPGTTAMTEIRKGYVSQQYIEQIMLYGLGHINAGRRVDKVALIFLPRAGHLSGSYVWSAPFDRKLAEEALERAQKVSAGVIYYKVAENPDNWNKIPATPSKDCTFCDWHKPELAEASDKGCPGK